MFTSTLEWTASLVHVPGFAIYMTSKRSLPRLPRIFGAFFGRAPRTLAVDISLLTLLLPSKILMQRKQQTHHNYKLTTTIKQTEYASSFSNSFTNRNPTNQIIMPCITARQARRSMGRRSSAIPRSSKGMENLSSVALSAGTEFSLYTHAWSSYESNQSAYTQSTASSTSVRSSDYNSSAESLQVYDMSGLATSLPVHTLYHHHQQQDEEEDSYGFFVDAE